MATISGVAVGTVSEAKDPAGRGRVRVRVPSVTGAQEVWAPTVRTGGGGRETRCREGDQVLVAFEHGDPQKPYVIGVLWTGENAAAGEPV